MNDPFVAGARALVSARDNGMINEQQYTTMYAALAKAAEQDNVRCEVNGCGNTAYIGKRCARHFDQSTLPGIAAEIRSRPHGRNTH